jgi:hypothetical protein
MNRYWIVGVTNVAMGKFNAAVGPTVGHRASTELLPRQDPDRYPRPFCRAVRKVAACVDTVGQRRRPDTVAAGHCRDPGAGYQRDAASAQIAGEQRGAALIDVAPQRASRKVGLSIVDAERGVPGMRGCLCSVLYRWQTGGCSGVYFCEGVHMRRLLLVAASAALLLLGMQPAAHAAKVQPNASEVFTVWDGGSYEYFKTCSGAPSFTCGTYGQTMYVQITGSWPPRNQPIQLGYQITDSTATSGVDYNFPTTGTVTIPAGQYVTGLNIPIIVDSTTEPSETFQVSLTSSSVAGTSATPASPRSPTAG